MIEHYKSKHYKIDKSRYINNVSQRLIKELVARTAINQHIFSPSVFPSNKQKYTVLFKKLCKIIFNNN